MAKVQNNQAAQRGLVAIRASRQTDRAFGIEQERTHQTLAPLAGPQEVSRPSRQYHVAIFYIS